MSLLVLGSEESEVKGHPAELNKVNCSEVISIDSLKLCGFSSIHLGRQSATIFEQWRRLGAPF